ncbi:MAG: pilus assembly FimT family protein [Candidatus Rokuibacteriota bacterium]
MTPTGIEHEERSDDRAGTNRRPASLGPWISGSRSGFSLVDLIVAMTICGILVAVGVPLFIGYYRAAQLTTGAQQVRTLINQARQLALQEKGPICIQVPAPTQLRYYRNGTCTGSPWVSSVTDSGGNINLLEGFTVKASANPVFNNLGGAFPAATYTVTNASTSSTQTISVATSGRVSIP